MSSIATSPAQSSPSWGKLTAPKLAGLFFAIAVIFYCLTSISAVSRIRFGDGPMEIIVQRGFLPTLVLVACAYLYVAGVRRLNLFSVMLVFLMFYGSVLGVLKSGINPFFISHLFQAFFGFTLYLLGRNLELRDPIFLCRALDWVAKSTIVVNVPVILLFVFWYITAHIYFGFGAGTLILSIAVCMHQGRRKLVFLAAFLLLLTGKRGDILGAALTVLSYIALSGRFKNLPRIVVPAMGIVAAGAIGIAVLQFAFNFDVLNEVLGKFASLASIDVSDFGSVETRDALGGRGMELVVFFDTFFNQGLQRLLTGLGYGWSAYIDYIGFDETQTIHFVHVSPLNAIGQYGLILATAYWGGIFLTVGRAWRRARSSSNLGSSSNLMILVPFTIGMLTDTMTAYAIAVDPMIWIALGAISLPSRPSLMLSRAPTLARKGGEA